MGKCVSYLNSESGKMQVEHQANTGWLIDVYIYFFFFRYIVDYALALHKVLS